MRIIPLGVEVCLCLGVLLSVAGAQDTKTQQIERGRYLVSSVGLCGDCHTPMNDKGESVKEKWLRGAPVFFKPSMPVPDWAESAPDLTTLKGWTDADLTKFLMTGIQPNGQPARPPMPPYRLNKEDADAVTAYLRSLNPPSQTEALK